MQVLDRPAAAVVARRFLNGRGHWQLAAFLCAGLLLLALVFHQFFLAGLGEALVVSDPLQRADLIYVMAGDFWGSRVLLGAKLGAEGWAPKVMIGGGVYNGDGRGNRDSSQLAVDFAVQQGYQRDLFEPVFTLASSTIDEAQALGPVFHRAGAHRIILVTSNFHSRRALEVFRLFLPEFDFRMEGAPDPAFDPRDWWKKPRQRDLLLSEYEKSIGTMLVRFHLAGADWLREVRADVS